MNRSSNNNNRLTCPSCSTSFQNGPSSSKEVASLILEEEEDGGSILVCSQCGMILQEQQILQTSHQMIQEQKTKFITPQTVVSIDSGMSSVIVPFKKEISIKNKLNHYCQLLKLPSSLVAKTFTNYCEYLVKNQDLKNKRGDVWLIGSLYLTLRQEKIPITLHEISNATRVDIYTLGNIIKFLSSVTNEPKTPQNPKELINKFIKRTFFDSSSSSNSPSVHIPLNANLKNTISETSYQIYTLSNHIPNLKTQRLDILSMTCISIALGFHKKHRPNPVQFEQMSSIVSCSTRTLTEAHRIIVHYLLKRAKTQFKHFHDLNRNSIYKFGLDLLKDLS